MATDGSGTIDSTAITPTVNVTICSGCGRCVAVCPEKIFTLETVKFHKIATTINPERCNFCKRCIDACPIAALH